MMLTASMSFFQKGFYQINHRPINHRQDKIAVLGQFGAVFGQEGDGQNGHGKDEQKQSHLVRNGVVFLSESIPQHHQGGIGGEGGIGRGHKSVLGDEQIVADEGNHGSGGGDEATHFGLFGQFIPNAEVVVQSQADVGTQQHGDDRKSACVVVINGFLHEQRGDPGHENHGEQVNAAGGVDEHAHHVGVGFFGIGIAAFVEEEGFCGESEGLNEEGEDQAEFVEGRVHACFGVGDVGWQEVFEQQSVYGFVDHPGESNDDEGERVLEHPLYQGYIKAFSELGEGARQQGQGDEGGQQVAEEDVGDHVVGVGLGLSPSGDGLPCIALKEVVRQVESEEGIAVV